MIHIYHYCVERVNYIVFWVQIGGPLRCTWSTNQNIRPIKAGRLMSLGDFRNSLYLEKEDEVKEFLMKYDINKPENGLGCVSETLWFIVSGSKFHTLVHRFSK
jgi:hypothetical protein